MSNLNPNENQSLLSKLVERLKLENIKDTSLIKAVKNGLHVCKNLALVIILSGALILSPGCSCANQNSNTTTVTDSGGSHSNSSNDKYSDYSNILKTVLTDSYYKNLVEQYNKNPEVASSGYFDPHPYGFLEDEGYNIEEIKKGQIYANTYSYVLDTEPNNLYLATRVENKDNTNCYTQYILKYSLTEEEMDDYQDLNKTKCIYSLFINDVISKQKPTKIINKIITTKEAYETIFSTYKSSATINSYLEEYSAQDMFFVDLDASSHTFKICFLSCNTSTLSSNGKLVNIPFCAGLSSLNISENGTFYGPIHAPGFFLDSNKTEKFQFVTFYCVQYADTKKLTTSLSSN